MCNKYSRFEFCEIGQWWGTNPKNRKQVQIDIVAKSIAKDEYFIGSCKYRNEKIGVDELALMREYAQVFAPAKKSYFYLFSKGGFTKGLWECQERGEVMLLTLEDLYSM